MYIYTITGVQAVPATTDIAVQVEQLAADKSPYKVTSEDGELLQLV